MTQAVRDLILKPMRELYLPPLHLRAARDAQERALAAYEKALSRFDRATLERAWEKVVAEQTYWVWPNPGVIAAACRKYETKPRPPSDEEQRQAKAMALADDYANHYMKRAHLARLARREGWAAWLRAYVAEAAWVQAQLICQTRHIGWNTCLADNLGTFKTSEEAFQAYRETLAKQVERGQIRVFVPRGRVQQWQERHRQAAQEGEEPAEERSLG